MCQHLRDLSCHASHETTVTTSASSKGCGKVWRLDIICRQDERPIIALHATIDQAHYSSIVIQNIRLLLKLRAMPAGYGQKLYLADAGSKKFITAILVGDNQPL